MARLTHIVLPCVPHHVTQRGNRRLRIFFSDDDRHEYLRLLATAAQAPGTSTAINTYDPYGQPGTANAGRFQYTGQAWLEEVGLYHYKARFYSPILGRFLQVDPIGYEDQVNLYAYVGNDPINGIDPTGTDSWIISRPVAGGFDHAFILVQNDDGLIKQFSYGPNCGPVCALVGNAELKPALPDTFDEDKTYADKFLAGDTDVNAAKIDADDDTVIAMGKAMNKLLRTNSVPYRYRPASDGKSCNSNCAAYGVANKARGVQHGPSAADQKPPRGAATAPGRSESGRLESGIRISSRKGGEIRLGSRIRRKYF